MNSSCSHEPHEGTRESDNVIPTYYPPSTDTEPSEDLVSDSGFGSADYVHLGDSNNEEVTAPTQMEEEFETYDPVTHIWEHVFVVKMIPPFIKDSRNEI